MSQVTYFPRYSQKENIVTNNTLLLLRRLHIVSEHAFTTLIESLGARDDTASQEVGHVKDRIGLRFAQQVGTGSSVTDGWIEQQQLRIVIETKLGREFPHGQLKRHARALRDFTADGSGLLLLLSPSRPSTLEDVREAIPVPLLHVTFADLIEDSMTCFKRYGVAIQDEIEEYEQFCEEMSLLPSGDSRMLVAACTGSFEENMEYQLYYHPADKNFRAAKYFGVYRDKRVQAIGREAKRVVCEIDVESRTVKPLDLDPPPVLSEEEQKRIIGTVKDAKRKRGWDLTKGHRWFLCDEWEKTCFKKESKGGVRGRRYLDLRKIVGEPIPDLKTLAGQLREKTFE